MTRTVWSRMLAGEAREVAFTFEATVVDAVFVVGPAIVAALAAVTAPRMALLLAAVIALVGCVGLATAPALSVSALGIETSGGERRHWLGPLRHGRVLAVLPVGMLAMGSIAVVEIATVGFAGQAGSRAASGILLALLSVGGIAGGLCWAARRQPGTHVMQLAALLIVLAITWFVLSLSTGIIVLAVLLIAGGLVMNPATTAQLATMSDLAPRRSLTEAFGWLGAATAAGEGLGAAASGVVVDLHPEYGFWLAAGMAATAAALTCAFLIRRRSTSGGTNSRRNAVAR
ncbi:MAG: MFS transporter [Nocardioidaceae bacterium]